MHQPQPKRERSVSPSDPSRSKSPRSADSRDGCGLDRGKILFLLLLTGRGRMFEPMDRELRDADAR
jgi:hypothetical protein